MGYQQKAGALGFGPLGALGPWVLGEAGRLRGRVWACFSSESELLQGV